jgi:hypothetical protein
MQSWKHINHQAITTLLQHLKAGLGISRLVSGSTSRNYDRVTLVLNTYNTTATSATRILTAAQTHSFLHQSPVRLRLLIQSNLPPFLGPPHVTPSTRRHPACPLSQSPCRLSRLNSSCTCGLARKPSSVPTFRLPDLVGTRTFPPAPLSRSQATRRRMAGARAG